MTPECSVLPLTSEGAFYSSVGAWVYKILYFSYVCIPMIKFYEVSIREEQ